MQAPEILTRHAVEAAYVHPAPAVPGHPVAGPADLLGGAKSLFLAAEVGGFQVKAFRSKGWTPPTWRVNQPNSKPNPGPPVNVDQYHGDLVDSVMVVGYSLEGGGFRAVFENGKIQSAFAHAPGQLSRSVGITALRAMILAGSITPTPAKE